MIRVRFAPSPTGYLHVGGARTALFNWLYARRHGGTFVLRIEDTDAERSSEEMVEGILQGMRWLGLDWDEGPGVGGPHGPYFQSQRFGRHREAAEQLVASGHAYYDFTPPEQYEQARKEAEARGEVWRYRRADWMLPPERIAELTAAGAPRAIRFKVPEGRTSFVDLVHGPVEFDNANIEDFVIVRSDGLPTYHLSVVCDDIDMRITHVIRGDDHVSNTPKHVLLFRGLGAEPPQFAHVPLILGPDKKRLSKRHGATSVMEYQRQGYLPEAMVNFLALLGWSPGNDQELFFSKEELIQAFSLEGIGTANAVFNPEKLEWMNSQHLMRMDTREVARRIEPLLREAGLWRDEYAGERSAWLDQVIELFKPRAKRLPEFVERGRLFFADVTEYEEKARAKLWAAPETSAWLAGLADSLQEVEPFEPATIEPVVRGFAEVRGVKSATLMQAVRLAISGSSASPGLFEMIALVGRERTVERLRRAADFIVRSSSQKSEV
ncbi:MAG TPA: glutamate--tRNA ligase [Vicinamibacterales bacterium]